MSLLGYGFHVLFIKNLEGLGIAEPEDFLSKELDTEGVDSADEVTCIITTDKAIDSVAHFLCGLIGEGQA